MHYPGLVSHPDHLIARQQMRGFGGVVSFEVDGGLWETAAFIDAVKLPYIAPSLGSTESLIEQPTIISYWDQVRLHMHCLPDSSLQCAAPQFGCRGVEPTPLPHNIAPTTVPHNPFLRPCTDCIADLLRSLSTFAGSREARRVQHQGQPGAFQLRSRGRGGHLERHRAGPCQGSRQREERATGQCSSQRRSCASASLVTRASGSGLCAKLTAWILCIAQL